MTFDSEKNVFHVVIHDLRSNEEEKKEYDYVVVASGHYSIPNFPFYKGFDRFEGRILHSH